MLQDSLTVMMLSSDDLKMKLARVQEAGLDAYLMKPIRRTALVDAIAAAMMKRGASLTLPVESRAASPDITPEEHPLRILLVDDSRDNRLLVRAYLKNTQSFVEEAENGAIAVHKVKSETYDLVLMDIQMPVMDGLEAMAHIRQWEKDGDRARTRIIALTASALESDVRRCLEAGADLHLSKPIKKRVLLAAVHAPQLDATGQLPDASSRSTLPMAQSRSFPAAAPATPPSCRYLRDRGCGSGTKSRPPAARENPFVPSRSETDRSLCSKEP